MDIRDFEQFPFRDLDEVAAKVTDIRDFFYRTATTKEEQCLLYELASGVHDRAENGHILEIGTDYGSSTSVMAIAARDHGKQTPVFTLDLYKYYTPLSWDPNYYPVGAELDRLNTRLKYVRQCFHELEIQDDVCQLICYDKVYLPFWNHPLRLAFVDGSHSYTATTRGLHTAADYLVDDGWCALHDYNEKHPEVVQAVNDFLDNQWLGSMRVFRCDSIMAIQKIGGLHIAHAKLA